MSGGVDGTNITVVETGPSVGHTAFVLRSHVPVLPSDVVGSNFEIVEGEIEVKGITYKLVRRTSDGLYRIDLGVRWLPITTPGSITFDLAIRGIVYKTSFTFIYNV